MTIPMQALLDPAFVRCLEAAAAARELLTEFDRLNGTNLALTGAPIAVAIDIASGRIDAEVQGFAEFVFDAVYCRVGSEVLQQLRGEVPA